MSVLNILGFFEESVDKAFDEAYKDVTTQRLESAIA